MGDRLRRLTGVPQRELGVAADGGERRAQLVAGVGGEPAQPRLAGRAALERRLHMAEHAIERQADLAGLGHRVGVRHAAGQLDLTRLQRQLGDLRGGGRHPAQRAQRQPYPHRAEHPGEQQHRAEDGRLGKSDVAKEVVHAGGWQAGDVGRAGRIGDHGQPVPAVGRLQLSVVGRRRTVRRMRRDRAQSALVRGRQRDLLAAIGRDEERVPEAIGVSRHERSRT